MTFTEEEVEDMLKMTMVSDGIKLSKDELRKTKMILEDFKFGNTPTKLLDKICMLFNVKKEDVISSLRSLPLLKARVVFFQECQKKFPYMHYTAISLFIGKDRSTIYRYARMMAYDRTLITTYNEIKDKI